MEPLNVEDIPKRRERALTQRYDMTCLREIQKIEEAFMADASLLYGCEEDDLPFDTDLNHIYNVAPELRRERLVALMRDPPSDPTSIINDVLAKMVILDATPHGFTGK